MATVVLDPVTRLEGHLKVTLQYGEDQTVSGAWVSGQMFRGIESILAGRPAADAALLTQRVCGVCPVSHAVAASAAVEKVATVSLSPQAQLLRNLVQGADFVASHILHFYHLSAMDYLSGPQMSPWNPHPGIDLRFSESESARFRENYLRALHARRRIQEAGALFGGKLPHAAAIVPGGVTTAATSAMIAEFRTRLLEVTQFVESAYGPDVTRLAEVYSDGFTQGCGPSRFLSFGAFVDSSTGRPLIPSGFWKDDSLLSMNSSDIAEHVAASWYNSSSPLHPSQGETLPSPARAGAYSWTKAPRLGGMPVEVGPLARMWISGEYRRGVSTMDRHLARLRETRLLLLGMEEWLGRVTPGQSAFQEIAAAVTGSGEGLTEAPRGALGHWASFREGKIVQYQVISPTCWNASPRDDNGVPGPLESALVGTSISTHDAPVEALRIIHAFDPCTACSVQ